MEEIRTRKLMVRKIKKLNWKTRKFHPSWHKIYSYAGIIEINENTTAKELIRMLDMKFGDGKYDLIPFKQLKTKLKEKNKVRQWGDRVGIVEIKNGKGHFIFLRKGLLMLSSEKKKEERKYKNVFARH